MPSTAGPTARATPSSSVRPPPPPPPPADPVPGGPGGKGPPTVAKPPPPPKTMRSLVVPGRAACSDGPGSPGGATLPPADPTPGFQPGPDELLIEKNAKG